MILREVQPKMAVHCSTEQEAKSFLNEMHKLGYTYLSKNSLLSRTYYNDFKEKICYSIERNGQIGVMDLTDAVARGYAVKKASDIMLETLSAKEVLEWIKDHCFKPEDMEECFGSDVSLYEALYKFGSDVFLKKIAEWKSTNKKEKPEIELVYVCRILDAATRDCVHEFDLYDFTKEVQAEEGYKDYISKHEGQYIAVVEHICRVKE